MKKVNCFIWCSKKQIYDIIKFFVEYENKEIHFEILTWNKTNPTPATNNVWLPDIEYCLYFREKGITLNDGYEHKSKWYTSAINKKDKDIFEHPTIKPLPLVKRHLLHATQPNDIVLDCFIGSGTTAIACKEIGRQFIGFEISEKWCKVSNDRLNNIDANGQILLFAR
jgi:DNA modification methylase